MKIYIAPHHGYYSIALPTQPRLKKTVIINLNHTRLSKRWA